MNYPVFSSDHSPYQAFLDVVEVSSVKVGARSLAMLCMVNKETRERGFPLLKKSLKLERLLFPKPLSKLLLFDANRHYMTIQHVEGIAFKVRVAEVSYLLLKDNASVYYENSVGQRLQSFGGICDIFPLIIKALDAKRGVRLASKRLGVPVKTQMWFENVDNTPHAVLGKLNLLVYVDIKHTDLMVAARRRFNRAYSMYEGFGSGEGVKLCLLLQCIKFD